MTHSLSVRDVSIKLSDRDRTTTIVSNASWDFTPATFTAIVGPSGAGKTSLLRSLAGLDTVGAGQILYGTQVLSSMSTADRAAFRLDHLAVVFQSLELIGDQTAAQNAALVLRLRGVKKRAALAVAQRELSSLGLDGEGRARVRRLSGGEQQRVALARAFAASPEVLLADEPTAQLDDGAAEVVAKRLTDAARRGAIVIAATHDPRLSQYADCVLRLEAGRLLEDVNLADGTSDDEASGRNENAEWYPFA